LVAEFISPIPAGLCTSEKEDEEIGRARTAAKIGSPKMPALPTIAQRRVF
jgi:hypothetical protein